MPLPTEEAIRATFTKEGHGLGVTMPVRSFAVPTEKGFQEKKAVIPIYRQAEVNIRLFHVYSDYPIPRVKTCCRRMALLYGVWQGRRRIGFAAKKTRIGAIALFEKGRQAS